MNDHAALQQFSFSGEGYECRPAHVASGKMALHLASNGSGMKTRGMWLAEALNGRWTGRDRAYLFSPRRAALWHRLYEAGFDGKFVVFWGGRSSEPEKKIFQLEGHPDMTEKEAIALLGQIEQMQAAGWINIIRKTS